MLSGLTAYVGIADVVDVLATSVLIYYVLLLIRGTRAVQILIGILVLVGLLGVATFFRLYLLGTILRLIVVGAAVTIPIVFQPELRRALEQIGRGGLFRLQSTDGEPGRERAEDRAILTLASTASLLSRIRRGALVVIEQQSGLKEYCESGTMLHADISQELLLAIFEPALAAARRRGDRPRRTHRGRGLLSAAGGAVVDESALGNAPSRGARTLRADRCGRDRRLRAKRRHHHRSRRKAFAPGGRRTAVGEDASGGYAAAAPRARSFDRSHLDDSRAAAVENRRRRDASPASVT